MKVFISKRTRRAAERIDAYWRKHADIPETFAQEFLEAVESLEATPQLGLKKSRCHFYFERDHEQQMIRLLHVWDGRRKRPPKP